MNEITIRPIVTPDIYNAVVELSKADQREALLPTHVIREGNITIGSVSFVPFAMVWTDSKKVKVRDSQRIIQLVENHVAMNGGGAICLPVTDTCPYLPFMEKTGYFNIGKVPFNLFLKGLK